MTERDKSNDDLKTMDPKDAQAIHTSAGTPDSGSPTGQGSGAAGAGGQGSLGAATYNDSGNLTGPDSPAGEAAARQSDGQGQGDDLADRLGGGEGRGTGMSGAGAVPGDMRADRSEEDEERPIAEGIGDDPGAPGGMGGARARPAGIGRPPGGNSPPR